MKPQSSFGSKRTLRKEKYKKDEQTLHELLYRQLVDYVSEGHDPSIALEKLKSYIDKESKNIKPQQRQQWLLSAIRFLNKCKELNK